MENITAPLPLQRLIANVLMLLAMTLLAFWASSGRASADTQYYGAIEGKTYLNNYWGGYSHGVWGSTWVTSGAYHGTIREELHPEYASWTCYLWDPSGLICLISDTDWHGRPTKVVDQFANYVSIDDFMPNNAMRGWSWHKDWYTGDQGTTSDGY